MGRRPSFDRSSVLHAGLDLADEHGLAAVTMEAVARRIGVTPMALYRQVAGKADLLDGLVEMLLTEVPTPAVGSRGFAAALTEMADGLREVAHRHPGVFPLLLQRPATTPAAQQAREAVYVALVAAGVPPERVAGVERLVSSALLGFLASEVGGRLAHHPGARLDDDFARLKDLLAGFIGAEAGAGR
jgi:AcrR family transcriptional regulator